MPLDKHFVFSQSNLQDYLDCPRKFELRHINKIEWPALYCEPYLDFEKEIERGQAFHQMVHQHILGIDKPPSGKFETLDFWMKNFIDNNPLSVFNHIHPEFTLTVIQNGFRLLAKFDVIAVRHDNTTTIFDWKTSRKMPSSKNLNNRVQTRVYPLVLVEAGSSLVKNNKILPESVSMIYWFPEFPEKPEVIRYSQEQYKKDKTFIKNIIDEICDSSDTTFQLTRDEKKCTFCNYRSLCDRGVNAGNFENEDLDDFSGENSFSEDILDGLFKEISD
jgi:CRISPR/Cas system-associated exonuclease Cas4 (RecB family)